MTGEFLSRNGGLSWKLSVRTYYMGIPKMRLIYFLDFCIRVCTKLRLAALARMLSALKWIYCARSRYVNHRRAQEYRNQGAIAVFDRYPIRELWEMQEPMDGPRIDPQSTWKSMEEKYYDMIRPPDYLFVLQVTPEESLRRKQAQNSFQDEQILRRKIHVINQLQADGEKIFTFDTSVALDQNVLDIKRQLWNLF